MEKWETNKISIAVLAANDVYQSGGNACMPSLLYVIPSFLCYAPCFRALWPDTRHEYPRPVPNDRFAFSLFQIYHQYTISHNICKHDNELSLTFILITLFILSQLNPLTII